MVVPLQVHSVLEMYHKLVLASVPGQKALYQRSLGSPLSQAGIVLWCTGLTSGPFSRGAARYDKHNFGSKFTLY
jgi:hypothetical protein